MGCDDSRIPAEAIQRGAVQDPKIEALLHTYFEQNTGVLQRAANPGC